MLQAGVEVEQDDQAVVDPGAPDAPFVHQRGGMDLCFLGRDVVAPKGLRIDHDLGLGLRLDGIDDRLGLGNRLRTEDPGEVVHGPGYGGPGGGVVAAGDGDAALATAASDSARSRPGSRRDRRRIPGRIDGRRRVSGVPCAPGGRYHRVR